MASLVTAVDDDATLALESLVSELTTHRDRRANSAAERLRREVESSVSSRELRADTARLKRWCRAESRLSTVGHSWDPRPYSSAASGASGERGASSARASVRSRGSVRSKSRGRPSTVGHLPQGVTWGDGAEGLYGHDGASTLSSRYEHDALTLSSASLAERSLPHPSAMVRKKISDSLSTYRHAIYTSPYNQPFVPGSRRPATRTTKVLDRTCVTPDGYEIRSSSCNLTSDHHHLQHDALLAQVEGGASRQHA